MTEADEQIQRGVDAIAAREPAWDEVRAQRVYRTIQSGREAESARRPSSPRWLLGAATAAALIVGVALASGWRLWTTGSDQSQRSQPTQPTQLSGARGPDDPPTSPGTMPSTPTPAKVDASVLELVDGSIAELGPDARVQVVAQDRERTLLQQARGRVRYDVAPRPGRAFVVTAADVEVRVVGTAFTVDLDDERIAVGVERGLVEVVRGTSTVLLGRGDSLVLGSQAATVDVDPSAAPARLDDDRDEPRRPSERSVDALLSEANAARREGDYPSAAATLRELIATHPDDPQIPSALVTLGLVENKRGRFGAAAKAFRSAHARDPDGPLGESAMAEEAAALDRAGERARARTAAETYLTAHPDGAHAPRMRAILGIP